MNMQHLIGLVGLCLFGYASCHGAGVKEDPSQRAKEMLGQMNLTEKITMLHGHLGIYVGNIKGNERLGIPSINMQDGPQGFRTTDRTGPDGSTTAWPSALTVATSWDTQLLYRWASAMALEFKQKGANVQLAPGIGIARVPTAGRNFEYLSGEDPYLGAILVGPVIRGIQDQGVIANAKHWVNNEVGLTLTHHYASVSVCHIITPLYHLLYHHYYRSRTRETWCLQMYSSLPGGSSTTRLSQQLYAQGCCL
jgi:beta-glucosidase-like glycosyl hydrolase